MHTREFLDGVVVMVLWAELVELIQSVALVAKTEPALFAVKVLLCIRFTQQQ